MGCPPSRTAVDTVGVRRSIDRRFHAWRPDLDEHLGLVLATSFRLVESGPAISLRPSYRALHADCLQAAHATS